MIQDKNVQKQIDRMNKGREEKERLKMLLERGVPIPKDGQGANLNVSTITATSKRPGTSNAVA